MVVTALQQMDNAQGTDSSDETAQDATESASAQSEAAQDATESASAQSEAAENAPESASAQSEAAQNAAEDASAQSTDTTQVAQAGAMQLPAGVSAVDAVKALRPDWKKNFFGPHVIEICQHADVVFMALHGENGENGKIQACFDLNGIRYTGTDYVSSAICMNKAISKDLFAAGGVPTPVGIRLKKGETPDVKVPYPCVVKACCGGSSVGVVMADNDEEYAAALEEAFKYDDEVVIEQYIKGREFSVGVVDGKAYPIIEIANRLSFSSQSHFIQQFREVTGMTPGKYRDEHYMIHWDIEKELCVASESELKKEQD